MKNAFTILSFALLLALCASACSPVTAQRGNYLKTEELKRVQAGVDTESDVIGKLGSPTTKDPFNEKIWFYLGQRTSKTGIFDDEVEDERIVRVTFGADGLVDSIHEIKNQREEIPVVERKTPTGGHDYTAMQQLLGNLGRFNKAGENSGPIQ
ncbi:MAG: outer membrane protein assembly factor BamE [Alphaproteobacteria bacterium]|nr:outer membrane protein assembly factor BamE [Alphaproteobacteria bacterium]